MTVVVGGKKHLHGVVAHLWMRGRDHKEETGNCREPPSMETIKRGKLVGNRLDEIKRVPDWRNHSLRKRPPGHDASCFGEAAPKEAERSVSRQIRIQNNLGAGCHLPGSPPFLQAEMQHPRPEVAKVQGAEVAESAPMMGGQVLLGEGASLEEASTRSKNPEDTRHHPKDPAEHTDAGSAFVGHLLVVLQSGWWKCGDRSPEGAAQVGLLGSKFKREGP